LIKIEVYTLYAHWHLIAMISFMFGIQLNTLKKILLRSFYFCFL